MFFPIDQPLPMGWRGEESPDRIALEGGHLPKIAKDNAGRFVPGYHVPSSSQDKGGTETLMIQEVL
jgi:hypothetical protein